MSIKSKIGAHVSIAGGIDKAPQRAFDFGCETFQCFTRSPQGGPAPKLTDELVASFKSEMTRCGLADFYIHTPYYINLASATDATRASSVRVIREELERGSVLGARAIMTHIGSAGDKAKAEIIDEVAKGFVKILDKYTGSTQLLIEISAGAGSVIGDTFEEVGAIMSAMGLPVGPDSQGKPVLPGFGGICFDTCHAFASGYDYRTPDGLTSMLAKFDEQIGLHYLKLTHVNDCKGDVNSKKDRHEHIGQGFVGEEGMRGLLTSAPFSRIDWLLETEEDGREADVALLQKIRG